MDTAKVDIRKLQLLNDRINQCIDALSQVRLSVHGLAHSSLQQPNVGTYGFAGQGMGALYGAQPGFGAPQVYGPHGYGSPFGLQGQIPGAFPYVGGMAHTTAGQPFSPFPQGLQTAGSPWLQPLGFAGPQAGFGQPPWPPFGLSHTSPETELYGRVPLFDPFIAMRIAQTFPYAQYAVPPYAPIY